MFAISGAGDGMSFFIAVKYLGFADKDWAYQAAIQIVGMYSKDLLPIEIIAMFFGTGCKFLG
jgi:hypothetical protein